MQAGAFGWAVNEATGFKKTEKDGQESKMLCPRIACWKLANPCGISDRDARDNGETNPFVQFQRPY